MGEILHVATFDTICSSKFATNCVDHNLPTRYKETMDESKKLIEEEVNWTPNAKISTISMSATKSFLAKHTFNDNNDNSHKVLKGHQLKKI